MLTPLGNIRRDTPTGEQDPVSPEPYGPVVLRLPTGVKFTDRQVMEMSSLHPELRIEINVLGDLELLFPTNSITSYRNAGIAAALGIWAQEDGSGMGFDASAGFTLPNGALRSPDASWVPKSRLAELPETERLRFSPICPDFVVELRSDSDRLRDLYAKMEEYLENGARLGWLIDSLDPRHRVYIYRSGVAVEVLEAPDSLSGDPELPGFVLDMERIWQPAL